MSKKRFIPGHQEASEEEEEKVEYEEKTVYVGNIDRQLTLEDLETHLHQYGKIKQVISQKDQKGRRKDFVFVEYEEKEGAEKAVESSGKAALGGRRLKINYKVKTRKVHKKTD